jgi:leader peptidase (prepilin peptidase)/N-methyltransferase
VIPHLAALPAPWLAALAGILGLVVGSFLNVVAHRLPRMLEADWRRQCRELLEADVALPDAAGEAPLSLSGPASHCPQCGHRIRPWENVPLVSWLFLRGRCSACGWRIPARYPITELAAGALAAAVAWQLGPSWAMAAALLLTWGLLALAVIDLETMLLPDDVTLPLLWLGLLVNLQGAIVPLADAVIGAVAGYLSLWLVYHGFRLATGKEGMGHGDFKLLAALGAWLGWQMLPLVILLASVVGAVAGIALIATGARERARPIPFGPFLAAAGWLALVAGEPIMDAWLGL